MLRSIEDGRFESSERSELIDFGQRKSEYISLDEPPRVRFNECEAGQTAKHTDWVHSSVVERSTADRQVRGSTPRVPCLRASNLFFLFLSSQADARPGHGARDAPEGQRVSRGRGRDTTRGSARPRRVVSTHRPRACIGRCVYMDGREEIILIVRVVVPAGMGRRGRRRRLPRVRPSPAHRPPSPRRRHRHRTRHPTGRGHTARLGSAPRGAIRNSRAHPTRHPRRDARVRTDAGTNRRASTPRWGKQRSGRRVRLGAVVRGRRRSRRSIPE